MRTRVKGIVPKVNGWVTKPIHHNLDRLINWSVNIITFVILLLLFGLIITVYRFFIKKSSFV